MWAAIKARLRGADAEPAAPPTKTAAPAPSGGGPPPAPRPSAPPAPSNPGGEDELFTEGFLGHRLKEGTIDDVLDELEIVMLQSDVAFPVVERLRRDLRKELGGKKLKFGVEAEAAIKTCLERSARAILARPPIDLAATVRGHAPKPYVILFVGVNGTGKTTTIAKLAGWFRGQGLSSVIAAGDTFRAGAIEQLLVHGERLGIRVIRQQEGSDPAAVAYDAVEHARAKGVDVVLIDTAGRQHTNENLIEEAKKIRRVVKPQLTIFVGDALSGNDVVEQARQFNEAIGIDGLILTKLDADVKGGAALGTTLVTKKPILFVGLGQGYADLRPFDPDWMVQRLFAEGTAG
ncbi:MAG TPA: signal recognition particle-docking protein FtsY [Thermoplasmata archaeon]|nr:signal recognition particle-docking protein FtsY [Thermoplasmata archaeon]